MSGKCIRAACVLLAASLLLLTLQGTLASLYLIPRTQLFYVSARSGPDGWAISNEEDGVYLLWNSFYDAMPPDPSPTERQWHDPATSPVWGRTDWPRPVWGWPGYVYQSYGGAEPGCRLYRTLWLPRLPVAGLLLLWPALRWRARRLGRRPGFPIVA